MNAGRDPKAVFEILVREHADMLNLYLRAILHDESTLDDVFQETMLTAWRRLDDFDRTRPFGPWLRGIARRTALAHARRNRRAGVVADELVNARLEAQLAHIHARPGDTLDEKTAGLRDCLRRLSPEDSRAIMLRYAQSRTTEQMADQLDQSREAVKKRLQRARARLLECMRGKSILMEAAT